MSQTQVRQTAIITGVITYWSKVAFSVIINSLIYSALIYFVWNTFVVQDFHTNLVSFQTAFAITLLFRTSIDTLLYFIKKPTALLQGIYNELYYQRAIQSIAVQVATANSNTSPVNPEKTVDTPE
jgi:hypothetical protein